MSPETHGPLVRRRPSGIGRLACLVAGVALLAAYPVAVAANPEAEADLKAAFLFNFVKFVEWPVDVLPAGGSITACVVGDSEVAGSLARAANTHTPNGRQITVTRMNIDGPLRGCHLLYVSGIDAKQTRQLKQTLAGASVFTVSDFEKFAALGGVTNFFVEDGRLRFAINVEAAKRARLQISSKMLALAAIVGDQP